MMTSARGTQKRSSFLCHRSESGVEYTRVGRSAGWGQRVSKCEMRGFFRAYLVHLTLVNVEICGYEFIWSRKMQLGDVVEALRLCELSIRIINFVPKLPYLRDKSGVKALDVVLGAINRLFFPMNIASETFMLFFLRHEEDSTILNSQTVQNFANLPLAVLFVPFFNELRAGENLFTRDGPRHVLRDPGRIIIGRPLLLEPEANIPNFRYFVLIPFGKGGRTHHREVLKYRQYYVVILVWTGFVK